MNIGGLITLLALVFYLLNAAFIRRYISLSLPGLLEVEAELPLPIKGQEYLWEKIAGTGIVPTTDFKLTSLPRNRRPCGRERPMPARLT